VVNITIALGFTPKAFWLTSAPADPQFIIDLGSEVNYLTGPSQWEPQCTFPGVSDPFFNSSAAYVNYYQALYNSTAEFVSAQSYVSGLVLMLGIENATNSTNQQSVADAIRSLDLQLFYGDVKFDPTGENTAKALLTVQILDGIIQIIEPISTATANFIYPIPYPTTAPTNIPTVAPTTTTPTSAPTTTAPTNSPTTNSPTTNSPTTNSPTSIPTTSSPTLSPSTATPTTFTPTTFTPTFAPTNNDKEDKSTTGAAWAALGIAIFAVLLIILLIVILILRVKRTKKTPGKVQSRSYGQMDDL